MARTKGNLAKKATATDLIQRDFTVNLQKRLKTVGYKKRAPRAIREIKLFAAKQMGTEEVRLEPVLNKYIWSKGIGNTPFKVRIRCERKRSEDEDAANKLYTLVSYVSVPSFKGLTTETVEASN